MSQKVIHTTDGNAVEQVEQKREAGRLKKAIRIVTTHGLADAFVASRLTARAMAIGTPRPELVADVRSRIAAETYETAEILDGALDRLAAELGEGTFE